MSIEIDPDEALPARTDLFSALVAMSFGGAVTVGAWRMDRLEHLHINKYEIPGLVPGLLGAAILVLGLVLALRSIARGAFGPQAPRTAGPAQARTMALVFALTLFYALGLVGTGSPFWLATLAFVGTFIFVFDRERQTGLGRNIARQAALAMVHATATSAVVSLSFEYIFLVRLP